VIYHTYSTAGQVTVTLTVGDDSGVVSDPYTQTIKVGLILHALNWFYYTQITAITIIVLVAITAVWKVYTRRFRGKGP
jgi:PKD repeat protein